MVLIRLRENDLLRFTSKALTAGIYFRVVELGNDIYGMRIKFDDMPVILDEIKEKYETLYKQRCSRESSNGKAKGMSRFFRSRTKVHAI